MKAAIGAAIVLVGAFTGLGAVNVVSRSTPGAVFEVGVHLCKANEGLRELRRGGLSTSIYTFVCRNDAHFHDVPIEIGAPAPKEAPIATKDFLKEGG